MRRLFTAVLLSACAPLAQAGEALQVWNWNDYIAPQVLAEFTKATGIEVQYHTYSTAEQLHQALARGESIDLMVPSHDDLPALIKNGQLQTLDRAQLPNRQYLDQEILSKLAAFDPHNQYAIPYLWGAVGLAINEPQASSALGEAPPNSWNLLFNPSYSSKLAQCGISVLDAQEEVLSALLNFQGENISRSSTKQIQRAGKVLGELKPNLRYVSSERYIHDLQQGKLCIALAWVGDVLAAEQAGQPVRFIVPDEGAPLFIDSWVIPAQSSKAQQALQFINFVLQPKIAAQITEETLYPSANLKAREFIAPALRDQPGLYPDALTKRRLYALSVLPERLADARERVWQQFKSR